MIVLCSQTATTPPFYMMTSLVGVVGSGEHPTPILSLEQGTSINKFNNAIMPQVVGYCSRAALG